MYRSSIQRMVRGMINVLLALLATVSFLVVMSHGSPAHAAVTVQTSTTKVTVPVRAIILVHTARISALMRYTVLTGNTLSGIARAQCGRADDWPGIYAASRKVVGGDPNLILPGQVLTVECTNKAAPPVRSAAAPSRGGSYGHPYFCGDGDGDGWDMPCSTTSKAPVSQAHGSPTVNKVQLTSGGGGSGCSDPSGQLTASQVRMLWTCAGGPSWAASAAVTITTCESGMNTRAYNPSGATGLFQILGQVTAFGRSLYDAVTNALNAVAKFKASGDTWAQWVCKA